MDSKKYIPGSGVNASMEELIEKEPLRIASFNPFINTETGEAASSTGFCLDLTPYISGTAKAGCTVTLFCDGIEIGKTVTGADRQWSFTPETPLNPGSHKFSATASMFDPESGTTIIGGTSNADMVQLYGPSPELPPEPESPSVPTEPLRIASFNAFIDTETGEMASDKGVCHDLTPNISGTAKAGCTVTLFCDGIEIGKTVTGADRQWSFTPETPLNPGSHRFSATASMFDPESGTTIIGGTSNADMVQLFPRSSEPQQPSEPSTPAPQVVPAPMILSLMNDAGQQFGANGSNNGVCDDLTPTIVGVAIPGTKINIFATGTWIGETVADAQGNWSFTPEESLGHGRHLFTATASWFDEATGTELHSDSSDVFDALTLDYSTVPPVDDEIIYDNVTPEPQPSPEPHPAMITSVFNDENGEPVYNYGQTADTTPTLQGIADAGSHIDIYDNGIKIGETITDQNGHWAFTPTSALPYGQHSFMVTDGKPASDYSGNSFILEIPEPYTPAPQVVPAPMILSLMNDAGQQFGANGSNNGVCDDLTPTIVGVAIPGTKINIFATGTWIGETVADAQGNWSFTPEESLGHGRHLFTATASWFDEATGTELHSDSSDIFDALTLDYSTVPPVDDEIIYDNVTPPAEVHGIDLSGHGSNEISLTLNDVTSMYGDLLTFRDGKPELMIHGDADDSINIFSQGEQWDQLGSTTIDNVNYNIYSSGKQNATLLIEDDVHVQLHGFTPVDDEIIVDNVTPPAEVHGIDLSGHGSNEISLTLNDVTSMYGDLLTFRDGKPELMIHGDADDSINIFSQGEQWDQLGSTTIDNVNYNIYSSGKQNATLLIEDDVHVQLHGFTPVNDEIIVDNMTPKAEMHGIDLSGYGSNEISFTLNDVTGMYGDLLTFHDGKPELMINGDADDSINIISQGEQWNQLGTANIDNVNYNVYSAGTQNATLLIEDSMHVQIHG